MKSTSRSKPNPHTARLRLKGYSLTGFARDHGFNLRTVKAAIRGEKHGPKSKAILAALRDIRSTPHA